MAGWLSVVFVEALDEWLPSSQMELVAVFGLLFNVVECIGLLSSAAIAVFPEVQSGIDVLVLSDALWSSLRKKVTILILSNLGIVESVRVAGWLSVVFVEALDEWLPSSQMELVAVFGLLFNVVECIGLLSSAAIAVFPEVQSGIDVLVLSDALWSSLRKCESIDMFNRLSVFVISRE